MTTDPSQTPSSAPPVAEVEPCIRLEGRLDADSATALWRRTVKALNKCEAERAVVDASAVTYCDGAGLGLLLELRRTQLRRGKDLDIVGLAEEFARLLDQFAPGEFLEGSDLSRGRETTVEQVGHATAGMLRDARTMVAFVGETLAAVGDALLHPRNVRWRDALFVAETAGANAVPLVILIGFIIGLVMAFQAAMIMRQFGVEIFVADMVAISMFRELGPLMTAIVLAGRSSSAFAAEIGTMKVNEEIDALTTMGLDPVRFLVVTRVTVATLVTPLLTMCASLAGLVGGAFVLLSMGTPMVAFTNQVVKAIDYGDLAGGLAKALVFGALVGGVGCLRGLQTRSGASAVGQSTTSAVVSSIVLIAVVDGIFSVSYYLLGI